MDVKKPTHLGGLIGDFLRQGELGKHFAEEQVKEEWMKLAGGNVARYTKSVSVKDGKLFVKLTSPLLKNDLMMQRSVLMKRLNEKVGQELLNEIIFL